MSGTVTTIDVQGKLPKVASGKVRDLFAVDDNTLLFVASDRISAYDVIMENVSSKKETRIFQSPNRWVSFQCMLIIYRVFQEKALFSRQ